MHAQNRAMMLAVGLSSVLAVQLVAQEAEVTPLLRKQLPDVAGKEALMLAVDYAPGGSSAVHRHNADAFVYVLEGSIVMQVKGGEEVTLTAGQTFYEGPDDIHVVSRNASDSRPARFVVFLLKKPGVPAVLPVE